MISDRIFQIYLEIIKSDLIYINTIGQMGMLWWVSSTVFVFTIIKFFHKHKRNLNNNGTDKVIGVFITAFIISIIVFGLTVCKYILIIENELNVIMMNFIEFNQFDISSIFDATFMFMMIGTTSFVFFLIIWIVLFYLDVHQDQGDK